MLMTDFQIAALAHLLFYSLELAYRRTQQTSNLLFAERNREVHHTIDGMSVENRGEEAHKLSEALLQGLYLQLKDVARSIVEISAQLA